MAEIIERLEGWRGRYGVWQERHGGGDELGNEYPFVENKRAPFTPAHRALSMMSLALITSAGAYIDGTDPFDVSAPGGDMTFREIPSEVDATDLLFSARGYDPTFVSRDVNVQVPLHRLLEFEANGVIGQLNSAFWSFCGFIPDAEKFVDVTVPRLVERLQRYEVQAALLIPASRLCHQSVALAARAIEQAAIPTMMLAVERDVVEIVRPPRAGYYDGRIGSVAGEPNWPEHQRRVLDEALRLIEPIDQPSVIKLAVELESQVAKQRGEK
jgi:D-proline reductase (dithiol) PrdB